MAQFSEKFYIQNYGNIQLHRDGAYTHYVKDGESNGHMPVGYFDPSWWAKTHNLGKEGENTLFENYLLNHLDKTPSEDYGKIKEICFGSDAEFQQIYEKKTRSHNGLFDFEFLTRQIPFDETSPDIICHFLKCSSEGIGVSPSPFFDPDYYLANNPDVVRAGVNPYVHFIKSGLFEGRKPSIFLRVKEKILQYEGQRSFVSELCSPSELFELENSYELRGGDMGDLWKLSKPCMSLNLFFGEPIISDFSDYRRMLDVYKAFMGAKS